MKANTANTVIPLSSHKSPRSRSRHRLKGKIEKIHRGLAIYKTHASPYWFARIRDFASKRYIVKTTKETSKIQARIAATELEASNRQAAPVVDRHYSFSHYADRLLQRAQALVDRGDRKSRFADTTRQNLRNSNWQLLQSFGSMDVRDIKTRHWTEFTERLRKTRPDLSSSTFGTISATFRNVLKIARDEGVIDRIPDTPRIRQKDNPRAFFRFAPLVSKEDDVYKLLLTTAKAMAAEGVHVRGVPVTEELYDLILFVTHTFVRPTTTELYALRHADIQVANDPKRLVIRICDGKVGYREASSLEAAVSAYRRVQKRYPQASGNDFLFLPSYSNRETASRVFARQFKELLSRAGIRVDPYTKAKHTMYSLRHTAICMRLVLSKGEVNVFNLAKNAGTSVEQIERFYAKHLPPSAEMAKNLQTFGSGP